MDGFDPEQIQKDLDRLRRRQHQTPPSDEELWWSVRYQNTIEKIQDLQADLLHPKTTAEQAQGINERLRALRKRLSDLEAEEPLQSPPPLED